MQDNRNGGGVLAGLSVSTRADASAAAAPAHGSHMRPTTFTLVSTAQILRLHVRITPIACKSILLHIEHTTIRM
jgi:hypothetical protein